MSIIGFVSWPTLCPPNWCGSTKTAPGSGVRLGMRVSGDTVRFWEKRRLFYNGALGLLVLILWGRTIPTTLGADLIGFVLVVLALAAVANLLYSLVYVAELVLGGTILYSRWVSRRQAFFMGGTILAVLLALYVHSGAAPA